MLALLRSDLYRKRTYYVRIDNFVNKYLKITFQLGTMYLVSYRLGQFAYSKTAGNFVTRLLAKGLYLISELLMSSVTGIKVSPTTDIGPGFVIHNFSCIAIDAKKIGQNCTVNQCVSIGADYSGPTGEKPVLGDNVFVGSGAKILGDVVIGDNVVIAANALVLKSVPDNCTVSGVPARIISRQNTSSYLKFDGKE
jgi:serine O-acetyltransferase